MLELRPSCEHCAKTLPPHATDARICSFECTFCVDCVENVLYNVCPNCGGGFCPRPIRPLKNWKGGNFLGNYPAGVTVRHRPLNPSNHAEFAAAIAMLPPEAR